MSRRGLLEFLPALDGAVYFRGWNLALLHDSVRENRDRRSVKEIKQPVVHALKPDAKLINLVPKKVRFRPSKFMT